MCLYYVFIIMFILCVYFMCLCVYAFMFFFEYSAVCKSLRSIYPVSLAEKKSVLVSFSCFAIKNRGTKISLFRCFAFY